ncbi:glycoside hydrolase family 15 protein [Hydrogenimonas sp.]
MKDRLEKRFDELHSIILSRQDAITGLLPASTAINAHGDYTDAWVRDNVYSILPVWALSLAYGKHDPKNFKKSLLAQSAVKLMRGLLMAMMRQADHLERFKNSGDPIDALHAKYGTKTALPVVADDGWGHLQIDATSLFLLTLAQMHASGIPVVHTIDEVDFVQNLVHYISHAYATPDYGIWERGNKINHGKVEINASSVGMAKAALEALDGFNLFGADGSAEGVIHVVYSDIARARMTLNDLLPRESLSKETDAALLSIIGYPAYAIEEEGLVEKTRTEILQKLAGKYGCKRFLLDGHQCSNEDAKKLHYEPSELKKFENIECEWPLFFTYFLLDARMRRDEEDASRWEERLAPLFVRKDGLSLLPELYIVPLESIDEEKMHPGSQMRIPNENIPLVWAQSLYMLSEMLKEGLVEPEDIDPIGRLRNRASNSRHARFVNVPVIAENTIVKSRLESMGVASCTPEEAMPIHIMHAGALTQIHARIGKNEKLGISGRPPSVARSITTASIYRLAGRDVLFLPFYFDPGDFYFDTDSRMLVEHFIASLKFLKQHWRRPAPAILPFFIREIDLHEGSWPSVRMLLSGLQAGVCHNVPIRSGSLEYLARESHVEHIDDLHGLTPEAFAAYRPSRNEPMRRDGDESKDWRKIRAKTQDEGGFDERIEDVLLEVVTRHKRLAVGRGYTDAAVISQPASSRAILALIERFCGDNESERVLTQEIILHIGELIRTEPAWFEGITTLRPWYFVQLLVGRIGAERDLSFSEAYSALLSLAPHEIYNRLRDIVGSGAAVSKSIEKMEAIRADGIIDIKRVEFPSFCGDGLNGDWRGWRQQEGMMGRLDEDFYKSVWQILQYCDGIVLADKYSPKSRLGHEITLDATAGERAFAICVDDHLQRIESCEYRQLNIEALRTISHLFATNPSFRISGDLILDVLIGHAVRIVWKRENPKSVYDESRGEAWKNFYNLPPTKAMEGYAAALSYLLKRGGTTDETIRTA